MRAFLALPLLLLAAGCAPRTAAPSDAPAAVTALALATAPAEVGGFRIAQVHRYPDPSFGTLYRYRSESILEPDVYIYPLTETARRGGTSAAEQARAESELFRAALAVQHTQRRFDAYEVVSEQALRHRVGTRPVDGWHVHAVLTRRGEQRDTHQYLFVVGEQLVKVRTTFDRGAIAPAEVDSFLTTLLRGMLAR